jgi:hypothetical protein
MFSRFGGGSTCKQQRGGKPKSKLCLPDLDQSKAAVIGSLRSPESQRGYTHAIDEFIGWYCSEPRLSFNRTVVLRYAADNCARNTGFHFQNLEWSSKD